MEAITREEKFMAKILGEDVGELKPITRVEKFLAKIAENGTGGGGFGPTVTYGDTLTWDGNTEGHLTVEVPDSGGMVFVKLSDAVPTVDDMPNGVVETFSNGNQTTRTQAQIQEAVATMGIVAGEVFWVFPEDNYSFMGMVTIPEAGVYSANGGNFYLASLTIPGYKGFETTTYSKIPIESLPEGCPYVDKAEIPTYDGVLDGKETVQMDTTMWLVKMSDAVPAMEDLVGKTVIVSGNGEEQEIIIAADELQDMSAYGFPAFAWLMPDGPQMIMVLTTDFEQEGISATKGLYFVHLIEEGITVYTKSLSGTVETVHKMDAKYLPEMATIYTFKGIVTHDMVSEWADDDSPNTVFANELFNTILPLVLEGKTLFFLEIVEDYITDRFPCELITIMSSPFTAGEYQIEFRFSADRNSSKKAKIMIGNVTGD